MIIEFEQGREAGCGVSNIVDLTGRQFGRLFVIRREPKPGRRVHWLCLCDCGTPTIVIASNLRRKLTRSCGCLAKEICGYNVRKHGLRADIRYRMWNNARNRAQKKGLPFNLTVHDIPLVPQTCPLLGIPLAGGIGKKTPNSPSLDRIRPAAGYIVGNIQVISDKANAMKNSSTFAEFETLYFNWKAQYEQLIG